MTAPKKAPAKKRAARAPKPEPVPEPPEPTVVTQFPAWYRRILFSSGDRAMSTLELGVENMHDELLVPLLPRKDMMLEITVREIRNEG